MNSPQPSHSPRTVVAHIHLFKNAGTSVERSLQKHFGENWASYDQPRSAGRIGRAELVEYLDRNQHVRAISSHHLRPPLEPDSRYTFLPVVYLRHPLDRIRSAYDFERNQGGVSPSSKVAAASSFSEWIAFHRDRNSAQCRNFQTFSLTTLRAEPSGAPLWKQPIGDHLQLAFEMLDALPAFGIVEQYEQSWKWISSWIAESFPGFATEPEHANVSAKPGSDLNLRLESMARELGPSAFETLVSENEADRVLHEWATARCQIAFSRTADCPSETP